MYETSMLRQAIGDLQVGIVFFPASYWGFAIYETFEFWQAIGDLQGERPPEARPFRQAMEDSESMQIQRSSKSFHFPASYWGFDNRCKFSVVGKLLGICKLSAFLRSYSASSCPTSS